MSDVEPSSLRIKLEARPLYLQAQDRILQLLRKGAYPSGAQLPPEPELARDLGISRSTLREALRGLEQMGLVVRRHGVGNFVASNAVRIESGLEELTSLDTLAARHGYRTEVLEAGVRRVKAPGPAATSLGVEPGSRICLAESVRAIEGRPIAYYKHFYLPGTFNDLELAQVYGGSLLDLLVSTGVVRLQGAMTVVRAVAAAGKVRKKLSVKSGHPVLLLEQILYDVEGRALSYAELYYLTDSRLSFHILRRPPWSGR